MAAEGQAQNNKSFQRGISIDAVPFAYGKKVQIFLRDGNITNLRNTDSIVNFVDEDNTCGHNEIIEAAGTKVKQDFDRNHLQTNDSKHHGVIKTEAGKLPYKTIFHIPLSESLPNFESAIHDTLKQASGSGFKSIAFPALADHKYADSYLASFYGFENRANPACLRIIDIITNNENDYKYHDDEMTKRGENF